MTSTYQGAAAPTETPFVTYNGGQPVQSFSAQSPLATNPTAYSPGVTPGVPVQTNGQGTAISAVGVPSAAPGSSTPLGGASPIPPASQAPPPPGGGGGGGGGGSSPGDFGMTNPYAGNAGLSSALGLPSAAADALQTSQGTTPQSQGNPAMTGASRYATAQPPSSSYAGDVWVTVPVDKVTVANGKGTVTPTYSAGSGYQDSQTNTIPPTTKFGRL